MLLRKRHLHVLGSGQGAIGTAAMFGAAGEIVDAFVAGKLAVDRREVPLAELDSGWPRAAEIRERIVFVP